MLKLRGHDYGWAHKESNSTGAFDGVIDTWVCEDGWHCLGPEVHGKNIATGQDGEWIDLFPSSINVRKLAFELYPQKDPWLALGEQDCSTSATDCVSPYIHPYARYVLEIGFAHGKRRALRGDDPTISISTTVNLDDFR